MQTIVVGGALANKPHNGGEAWVRLSWVLGLQKLGYRTFLLEEIRPETCVDRKGGRAPFDESVNLAYFKEVCAQFGIRAALLYDGGAQTYGLALPEIIQVAEGADLLVNISGHLGCEPIFSRFRRKAYIDIDPGFTQFWHAAGNTGARLAGHDCYFTIAENIGRDHCSLPTGGVPWRTTRQPVVLEEWPFFSGHNGRRFTTVASWRGPYGPIRLGEKTFGLKVHEFRKFLSLPEQAPYPFEIALNISPADGKDLGLLRRHGWQIADPCVAAPDPARFRSYIQNSAAEFSVAQGIYVDTQSGWFSDRTVRYLAAGKPALVQDTGFRGNYPTGKGLVPFRSLAEAIDGAQAIMSDYDEHSLAARSLAETYFDSDKVLPRLLDEAF